MIATICILTADKQFREPEKFRFVSAMATFGSLDHGELVLRRTIHISNIPADTTEDQLRQEFNRFGPVERLSFDKAEADELRMAFVQFGSEEAASEAVRFSRVHFMGQSMRITHSRITIDVIPPTDAVFGKPLTVGRHVMAVNPSLNRHRSLSRRVDAIAAASRAAATVLQAIATRTGVEISRDEIKQLREMTVNRLETDS